MSAIRLPYGYTPRPYQRAAWQAVDNGYKRLLLIHHRRAGKDKTCLNIMVREAMRRVGTYFYLLPTFAQAKRIIWDGMDKDGFPFLSHIPTEIRAGEPNQTNMQIRLLNGSILQLIGTDKIDNVVGTNPVGCVFSEYSLQDPDGWDFLRPVLAENGGWAIFNGTPRGRSNHLYRLLQTAQGNPDWYWEVLGVDETRAISKESIDDDRRSGMSEELIQQEYYCSFDGGMEGAYYVEQMTELEKAGRVTDVVHDPLLPVHSAWDLGMYDETSIIYFQQSPAGQVRILGHYHASGQGLEGYIDEMRERGRANGWQWGKHFAPHDIQVRELGTGKSRLESARSLGITFTPVAKLPLQDGINAVRMMLAVTYFHEPTTERLRMALYEYRRRRDERNKVYLKEPLHNWASHLADAMRYLAVGRGYARSPQPEERYDHRRIHRGRRGRSWMAA